MIAWIPCSEPLGQSFQSGEVRKEIRLPRAIRLRAWTAMDNQWFARLAELPLLARQQLSFMQGCSGCFRALTPFAFGGLVAALALGTQARMDGPQPRVSGRTEGEVDGGVDAQAWRGVWGAALGDFTEKFGLGGGKGGAGGFRRWCG